MEILGIVVVVIMVIGYIAYLNEAEAMGKKAGQSDGLNATKSSYGRKTKDSTTPKQNDRSIHSKVYGAGQKNDNGKERQEIIRKWVKDGNPLVLKREPYNKFDANAIAIYTTSGDQIGYINKDLAVDISRYMDDGHGVKAKVTEVTGGSKSKPNYGVNILISF